MAAFFTENLSLSLSLSPSLSVRQDKKEFFDFQHWDGHIHELFLALSSAVAIVGGGRHFMD